MKILVLDSATERAIISIFETDSTASPQLLFHNELPFGYTNSQYFMPELSKGLEAIGIKTSQLEGIIAGVGPGSYTGIRVAAIVAKTLAYCHRIPLSGVSSLYGFVPSIDGQFATLIDAKMGGVYLYTGIKKESEVEILQEPTVSPLSELKQVLNGVKTIITPSSRRIKPLIQSLFPDEGWKWEESGPDAFHLLQKGKNDLRLFAGIPYLNLLYMRKTQAEIEKFEKH